MLLADTQESDQRERDALDRAMPIVEGVVLASSRMSDSTIRMTAKQKPMIVLNRAVSDVPSVVTDNPRGVRRAVEHLAELGHHTITYIGRPRGVVGGRRAVAFAARGRAGTGVAGPPPGPVPADGARRRPGRRRAGTPPHHRGHRLQRPDRHRSDPGVVAMGARVPADVSVVGFDNIFAAELITPRLTTVAAPLRSQGETAVHNLLAIIGGARPRAGEPVVLPVKLVVRDSTGRRAPGTTSPRWAAPGRHATGSRKDTPAETSAAADSRRRSVSVGVLTAAGTAPHLLAGATRVSGSASMAAMSTSGRVQVVQVGRADDVLRVCRWPG